VSDLRVIDLRVRRTGQPLPTRLRRAKVKPTQLVAHSDYFDISVELDSVDSSYVNHMYPCDGTRCAEYSEGDPEWTDGPCYHRGRSRLDRLAYRYDAVFDIEANRHRNPDNFMVRLDVDSNPLLPTDHHRFHRDPENVLGIYVPEELALALDAGTYIPESTTGEWRIISSPSQRPRFAVLTGTLEFEDESTDEFDAAGLLD
jgi:hypothetical protein